MSEILHVVLTEIERLIPNKDKTINTCHINNSILYDLLGGIISKFTHEHAAVVSVLLVRNVERCVELPLTRVKLAVVLRLVLVFDISFQSLYMAH